MRAVVLLAAVLIPCFVACTSYEPPYDPAVGDGKRPQVPADGPPPFTYGGQGGHVVPGMGGMFTTPGRGGAGGASAPDAEAPIEDAAAPDEDAPLAPDAPVKRDTRPDLRADTAPPDTTPPLPDAPAVRPDVTTITLDVSGVSPRGVMMVSGYGGFAFPFNPTIARRTLTTLSAASIVNLPSKGNLTCHADAAAVIKFISGMPVTSQGSATVVELRVDMPLYIAGDTNEHLPSEFCVGYRRGGTWTWQSMPMFSLLQRNPQQRELGRALLVAAIGPQPAGAPGVDALGVLAEGGAVVRSIEIDIIKK